MEHPGDELDQGCFIGIFVRHFDRHLERSPFPRALVRPANFRQSLPRARASLEERTSPVYYTIIKQLPHNEARPLHQVVFQWRRINPNWLLLLKSLQIRFDDPTFSYRRHGVSSATTVQLGRFVSRLSQAASKMIVQFGVAVIGVKYTTSRAVPA